VLGAWSTTRGAGVRVAVIDDAVEVTHPDLRPNHVDGQSLSYRAGNRGSPWPLPCTDAEGHGTAVAGLIVARDDNAIGGAGVAPRSAFVAFDALSSGAEADIVAALARAGEVNAIYHNSWGSPDDGALHAAPAAFDAAIGSGLASGRGGLGSVYVFSAGNGGCYGRGANGACLRDDANYDGFLTGLGTVVVCAVDDAGRQPFYGEPGANLTVCAPSSGSKRVSLTTTALQGAWRDDFTGTSGSAPQVSGVVALMLATNPQLTWRDVRLILAGTARQNDPNEPGWTTGYGYRFNHKYGFGVADAQAAVAAAAGWSSVGGSGTLKTCGPYTRSPRRALPDAVAGAVTPVTDAIAVAGCDITRIEWVQVRLTAPHPYAGDLRVRLTSPNGLVSRLADGRACASPSTCGSYADWRFGSMRHLGEPAAGTWTLELADTAAQDVGTFEAWSITLHGR
jgi:kexin